MGQWQPMAPGGAGPSLVERLGREGAGSRLLAWVGAAVTLLGIVLLLVLAVQRGWLGPLPRVLGGAAFGLALVGTGMWLHRSPSGRTGALALAATGIATLYLAVVAATTLYGFLPTALGLGFGLAVAVGGLWLAARWDSETLGAAVVVGCAVCAPMITRGFTPELVTFLLAVQVATAPAQARRGWTAVAISAGVPPLFASVVCTALTQGDWPATFTALGAGAVGIALALVQLRRRVDEPAVLALLAAAAAPALFAALFLAKPSSVLVAGGVAVPLLGLWAAGRLLPGHAGDVAAAVGLVAVLEATLTWFDGRAVATVLLGEAIALALVALWTTGRRVGLAGAIGFGAIGCGFALARDLPPALLLRFDTHSPADLAGGAVVAVLILGFAITLAWVAVRLGVFPAPSKNLAPWVAAGVAALYGAAGALLCCALLLLPDRTGFLAGHAAVTVSWAVAALVLLIRGIRRVTVAAQMTGLVLVGAAVLKLVLFDLATLDGMARVTAFLGAGLILLAAGTRYARLVTTRQDSAEPAGVRQK
ncbi:Predicted membrane protein [Actinokineospora iranica]|uniref:Predicted membrane protein n=2 Tax=Actinokineospora iranica TaxID=1271860 RepID=A0A1G6X825_9PSEU|nr:Predicted membrane protein [Actinokineospora iranica]